MFCFAEIAEVSPFYVESCNDMLHMDIFKILDKLKNDKKSMCPFNNTSRSWHKDIVRKKGNDQFA